MSNPEKTNLIAWWELNEESGTRVDSHGSNDLTDNATVLFAAGKQGNAANFETDTSEYLSIADNTDLSTGDIDFTICAWVNLETLGTGGIVTKDEGSGHREYSLHYNAGVSRFRFLVSYNGTAAASVDADTLGAPAGTTWYFIVCGHDSVNNNIFIEVNDGGEDTTAHTTGVIDSDEAFWIGRSIGGAYLDGLVDEACLYKRVLTSAERTWLYNSADGRAYSDLDPSPSITDNVEVSDSATVSLGSVPVSYGGGTHRLGLQVYTDATMTSMIADWSGLAIGTTFDTDDHGYGSMTAVIPMAQRLAEYYYNATPLAHVVLGDGAFHAYEGRIEDRALVDGGLRVTAFGYQRALSDLAYVALWSDTVLRDWRIMTDEDRGASHLDMFSIDLHSRIFIGLRKNEDYTTQDGGHVGISISGRNDIIEVDFDYDLYVSADYTAKLWSTTTGFADAGPTADWTLVGTGASDSDTASVTITANSPTIFFQLVANAPDTYTGDSGDRYLKITNVRVKAVATATLYADVIADDIVSYISSTNSTQLSSSTALIESPTVDLHDMVFSGEYPHQIMTMLAGIGDNSTPPVLYEWGVWEDQVLHFRQRGSAAQTWYTDVVSLNVDSTIDTLWNSSYAVYVDERGHTRHTADNTDAASIAQYGVTRYKPVKTPTTNATEAAIWRDAYLEDNKDITPRAQVKMLGIFSASGARIPMWMVRSGDTLVLRNLLPTGSAVIDKIRSFRISRTSYDVDANILTPTPEMDTPSLEFLVAQNAAQLQTR